MPGLETIRNHTHSPDDSVRAESGSHVQITKIDLGKEALLVILALILVIGGCGLVMGLNLSEQRALVREFTRQTDSTNQALLDLQRQYRMTELKLDDWTVVAHRSGLALPSDYTRGPQGNPDAKAFKIPQVERKEK